MNKQYNLIACDCGNSSTRVLLSRYDGQVITTTTILQEPNEMVKLGEYFYWDIMHIFRLLKHGIRMAAKQAEKIDSIGICTWGVDFSLFDKRGNMLMNPLCYRNAMGEKQMAKQSASVQREMFLRTGILSDKINSVYMLGGMQEEFPELLRISDKLLMIPDILNYFFTGKMLNEVSEISTTQLLDTRTMEISKAQCEAMRIDPDIFSPIGTHGKPVGNVLPEILEEMGISYNIPVVCVPSHDTACAVLGTPSPKETFAFISEGTWALIGLHCKKSTVTDEVLAKGLTNEVAGFGHIMLLKNSIGMFIMQRLRRDYIAKHGGDISWDALDSIAEGYTGRGLLVDVNHPDFFNPPRMDKAIGDYLIKTGQTQTPDWPAIVSAAHTSLAASFAQGLIDVAEVSKTRLSEVYVVGGGARNQKTAQLTADISGIDVVACGMECTSIGNALAQAAYLIPELSYLDLKKIAQASLETIRYRPLSDRCAILKKYKQLHSY